MKTSHIISQIKAV